MLQNGFALSCVLTALHILQRDRNALLFFWCTCHWWTCSQRKLSMNKQKQHIYLGSERTENKELGKGTDCVVSDSPEQIIFISKLILWDLFSLFLSVSRSRLPGRRMMRSLFPCLLARIYIVLSECESGGFGVCCSLKPSLWRESCWWPR